MQSAVNSMKRIACSALKMEQDLKYTKFSKIRELMSFRTKRSGGRNLVVVKT